ncbi:DUF2127 domain-containing protein [Microcoleus sp. AT3-D2]|uniref:DUF2127 domain-containing protein n=1 Tax=Microcoleus sp. AT3-D2 TaxID=2818612 RepID=UPI002FD59740
MKKQRDPGLITIVLYHSFVASILTVTSIALLFALKNHQVLEKFAASYLLKSQVKIVEFLLDPVLSITPQTLLFSGLATGLYAILTVSRYLS